MMPQELCRWAARTYGLACPVRCELLRSYTNDVYSVQSPDGRFVLKVYGRGWRTAGQIRYEVALTQHLAARGVPIACPVATPSGDFVTEPGTGDDCRPAVLFEHAPGAKPQPPFTPGLYRDFGEAIGYMHACSDDFETEHHRRPLDLGCLLDEPLALCLHLLEEASDRQLLLITASRVKDRMRDLAGEGLDWGPIHGDATLDNLHVTADGRVILYDLDSGGPGWRAADLQGWASGSPDYREWWEAFLEGYSRVRSPRPADLRAAPYLTVAWDIWGLKIDLERRILAQGPERTREYLAERLDALRSRLRYLPPG